jgi:hypothetical protein
MVFLPFLSNPVVCKFSIQLFFGILDVCGEDDVREGDDDSTIGDQSIFLPLNLMGLSGSEADDHHHNVFDSFSEVRGSTIRECSNELPHFSNLVGGQLGSRRLASITFNLESDFLIAVLRHVVPVPLCTFAFSGGSDIPVFVEDVAEYTQESCSKRGLATLPQVTTASDFNDFVLKASRV